MTAPLRPGLPGKQLFSDPAGPLDDDQLQDLIDEAEGWSPGQVKAVAATILARGGNIKIKQSRRGDRSVEGRRWRRLWYFGFGVGLLSWLAALDNYRREHRTIGMVVFALFLVATWLTVWVGEQEERNFDRDETYWS